MLGFALFGGFLITVTAIASYASRKDHEEIKKDPRI